MMMGFGLGGFGLIFMLFLWVVVIGLVVWLVGGLFPRITNTASPERATSRTSTAETPLEVLRRRYARGEISKAEYEQMRQALEA
ncbi:MAG: SHOCT domain-containing protein [Chloroflexi bacterium]|nr:SHOCT domain-containing protein [Chloroflexota bacterium]